MPEQREPEPTVERSRWSLWVCVGLAALAIYVAYRLGLVSGGFPERELTVDLQLPALELTALTGTDRSVGLDDLQGRVTLVNFWATWCGPCRMEFPDIVRLRHKFHEAPEFQLLSVVCDAGDSGSRELREKAMAFLASMGADFPTYVDPEAKTRKSLLGVISAMQGTSGSLPSFPVPATLVVDRQGVIRGMWIGFSGSAAEEMETLIAGLLGEDAQGR